MTTVKTLSTIAVDINHLAQQIEHNSIVLPLNYSDNPRWIHYSNYLGIDKPIVMLENYECNRGWFPLLWNLKAMPQTMIGDLDSDQPCIYPHGRGNQKQVKIDYIFVLGNMNSRTDSCNLAVKKSINEN